MPCSKTTRHQNTQPLLSDAQRHRDGHAKPPCVLKVSTPEDNPRSYTPLDTQHRKRVSCCHVSGSLVFLGKKLFECNKYNTFKKTLNCTAVRIWPELILICTLKLELQEQEPVFRLEYVSWRGIPHCTIILFSFNVEGPNCSIRVFLLIAITVWGQERRCGIQEENTPPVSGFHRLGVLQDEGLRWANVPEGQQLYYVWKKRGGKKFLQCHSWVTSCLRRRLRARVFAVKP